MFKRLISATRISAALILLVSIISPTQVAEASGTITKSITVIGADGQPYEGASVAITYLTTTGAIDTTSFSTIGVTNSSGQADVTFPDTAIQGALYAQPRVGDTTTAIYGAGNDDFANSSSATINFSNAALAVNILNIDGSNAAIKGAIWGEDSGFFLTLRAGAFGIEIPSNVTAGSCRMLQPIAADGTPNTLISTYGTKVIGTGDTRVVKVYTDYNSCSVEAPKVNGVYQVQLRRGNISGTLLSATGQPLTFSDSQGYEVNSYQLNEDGTRNVNFEGGWNFAARNTTWSTYIDTTTAGKYEIGFSGYGNPDFPSFGEKYVWVTADHKLSWSADGSNPADSLTQDINIPTPNLKFSFIDSATSAAKPAYYRVQKTINSTQSPYTYTAAGNGAASFKLSDGNYRIRVRDQIKQNILTYNVVVSGSSVAVTDATNATLTPENGIYISYSPPSNAFFKLKDSAGNPVSGFLSFCLEGSCPAQINVGANGLGDGVIPNGTYVFVQFASPSSTTLAAIRTTATVTNGVVSIEGQSKVNDVWEVTLPTANLKLSVSNPLTNSSLSDAQIDFENADDSWNGIGYYSSSDIFGQNPGLALAYLPNGKYIMNVNPHSSNANAGLAPKTYRVSVVGNVATVSSGGTNIDAVAGRVPVTASSSNFEISVKDLSNQPLTNGQIDICQDLGGGEQANCRGFGLYNAGQVSAYLANGNWLLTVRPGNGVTTMASRTYSVTVANGEASVTGLSPVSGRWIVTGSAPNLSGSFTVASGSLTFGNNKGVSVSLQKYVNGNWEWQNGGSWFSSANWAMKVSAQGQYRIVASPYNLGDLVQSYSSEFWINGSGKVSETENGTYEDSLTAISILLRAPNLKLTVNNPNDGTPLPGGWVNIMKVTGQSRNWIANADINPNNPGVAGSNLTENGNYILVVNPPNGNNAIVGLAPREFQLTVTSESMTVTLGGNPVTITNGRFVVTPAAANVTARVLKGDGTPFVSRNGVWVNASLQKLNSNNNWDWVGSGSNGDQNGYVSLRVEAEGKYRLRIEPSGEPTATITYSSEFTVTSGEVDTFKKDFGGITLAGPSIRISVAQSSAATTAISYSGVEIRKDGNWIDWANTSQGGIAGISLASEGTYEFVVNPPQNLQGSTAKKSYKVVATKNSDGQIVATVTPGTGVARNDSTGITTLLLGLPTLAGTVKSPDGSVVQPNAQIVAIDVATNRELWESSAQANQNGQWSMALSAGTYKIYARAPWGSSDFGNSDPTTNVVVDSSGVATTLPSGLTADAFALRLKAPRWSGYVKNPAGTTGVAQARVCLRLNEISNCANADSTGKWSLSAPAGFTDFTGTNPYLEINDDNTRLYPQKRWTDVASVTTAIGTAESNSIVLLFDEANTRITVTAGGQPVANAWVMAERDNDGYLGGSSTDANGVAKFNISNPTTAFRVRAEVNGNPTISGSYTSTMKSVSAGEITTGRNGTSIYNGTLALAEPNFKFALLEPTTDGSVGNPVPYSWVELFNETTGQWLGGTSTDINGFGSFKLDVPIGSTINNFLVTANPQWNSTNNFSKQSYAIALNSAATPTVINKTSTASVVRQDVSGKNVFPLTLGTPSVTGRVVDSSGNPIANSWVVPIDALTSEYLWRQGANSKSNGGIALSLGTGTYKIEANVPWGVSGMAKSAQCSVSVASGTVSSGGACEVSGTPKTIQLALRAPNLTFTLKIGGVAVPNANVGISAGSWSTNAQANSQGQVALFVDAVAIRQINNWTTAHSLNVWVDPPYGSSVMARWDCISGQAKPICSVLPEVPASGEYPTTALGNITGVSPNTRISIVAPGTSTALQGSWVTVSSFDPAHPEYGQRWLGGGNSDVDGFAAMNLETSTVPSDHRFMIEINAPWNQRQLYATATYTNSGDGYTWNELTNLADALSPASPNLVVTVKAANSDANKFGWIGIEEVNISNSPIKWVGGYGLNENGMSSVYLPGSNKRYKITAYPGPGKSGARTVCIVTAGSGTPATVSLTDCAAGVPDTGAVTISLDGGNVVGRVTRANGTVVVGAIVYANEVGSSNEATAIITATGSDGRYGLLLDSSGGKLWNIKVFPVSDADAALVANTYSNISAPTNSSVTKNFELVAP